MKPYIILLTAIGLSSNVEASTKVCFTLTNPTIREDGKPLPKAEIAGNMIQWTRVRTDNGKTESGKSTLSTDTSRCLYFTVPGKYSFNAEVVDTKGLVSKPCPSVKWSF